MLAMEWLQITQSMLLDPTPILLGWCQKLQEDRLSRIRHLLGINSIMVKQRHEETEKVSQ